MDSIILEQLKKSSSDDTHTISKLASQLGDGHKVLTNTDMQEMIESQNTYILVAREPVNRRIIGMVTIFVYRIPYTKKSYIDDFVVDKNYRGQGIGTKLFHKAIELVKEKGADYVDFTSSPEKIAGNKFYEKLGFEKRDTNVYRLIID